MRHLLLLLLAAVLAHAAVPSEKLDHVDALMRDGKLDAALAAANSLVGAAPNDAAAYALLGRVHLARADADAAVKAHEKAAELAPTNGDFQRQLGEAYGLAAQKAGMLSKMSWAKNCRAAYEKAVELEPNNVEARNSLMLFYQQAPSMMGGGIDKALAQAAAIKELNPTRGHLAHALLHVAEKKYAEARTEIEAVLAAEPENYAAWFQVGRIAALSGEQLDAGLAAFQKCLALTPPAGAPRHEAAHWRLGQIWERKGDKAAARAAYQAALALNPRFQQASDALAKLK